MLADIYLTLAPNHHYYSEDVTLCLLRWDMICLSASMPIISMLRSITVRNPFSKYNYSGSTEYDFWGGDNQSSHCRPSWDPFATPVWWQALTDGICLHKNPIKE